MKTTLLLASILLSTGIHAEVFSHECLGSYLQVTTVVACPSHMSVHRSGGLWDLYLKNTESNQRVDQFLYGLGFGIEDDGSLEEIKGDISSHAATTSSVFKYGQEVLMKHDRALDCDSSVGSLRYSQQRSEAPFEVTEVVICDFKKI